MTWSEKFQQIWDALEKVFPELANGQKILDMSVTEYDHVFKPNEYTSKVTIEFVYGYRADSKEELERK